jgi:hypothetical protein
MTHTYRHLAGGAPLPGADRQGRCSQPIAIGTS